ncbi:MAG TPA: ABC transporter permease [Proteobacteria bacterium]|nr:ABC transporter permease [Pseudomonadota bacterium]
MKTAWILMKMASRNLWRNVRRTLITMVAIGLGLALAMISIGLGDGGHEQMIESGVRMGAGHITVQPLGYQKNPSNDKIITDDALIMEALKDIPHVREVSSRIVGKGLISSAANSSGIAFRAVDPGKARDKSLLAPHLISGDYLAVGEAGSILIGEGLAQKLKVSVGKKVVLMGQDASREVSSALFRVKGIYKTGVSDLDGYFCLISLKGARQFLGLEQGITQVAVYLDSQFEVEKALPILRSRLGSLPVEVLPWQEVMPDLLRFVQLDDAGNYLFLGIILVIVALGILNTILMSVLERTREFGMMLALGLSPHFLFLMIIFETTLLALLSMVLGGGLGFGGHHYFATVGLDLTGLTPERLTLAGTIISPVLYSHLRLMRIFGLLIIIFLVTLTTGLYPAVKASRLAPVKAIYQY